MPELQDSLEIPVRPNQQTIRESFIRPRIGINGERVNHRGIKSLFKKNRNLASPSSLVLPLPLMLALTSILDATNTDYNDSDDDDVDNDDVSITQVVDQLKVNDTTSSTIHSRPSWIKSSLNYKTKQTMVHSMSIDPSRKSGTHKASSPYKHLDLKLKSKITEYEDSLSNPKDLKRWVQLIADKPTAPTITHNQDGSLSSSTFRSSSIRTKAFTTGSKNDQQQLEIDIDEFINYLINEQGFNRDDLQFLRMKNLDYGLGEIEQELNKLKDQQGKPKVIKIGGEEDHVNGGNKFNVYRHHFFSLVNFFIFFLL